jgi:hypothetical protein
LDLKAFIKIAKVINIVNNSETEKKLNQKQCTTICEISYSSKNLFSFCLTLSFTFYQNKKGDNSKFHKKRTAFMFQTTQDYSLTKEFENFLRNIQKVYTALK